MDTDERVLERLEASLRSAAAQSRDRLSIPGFDLFIDNYSDAYHLSFAVPTQAEIPWNSTVAKMQRAFTLQHRRARLEYVQELHPFLGEALEAAGFLLEMRAPLMVLTPERLAQPLERLQARYERLRPEVKSLEAFLRGQGLAYGGSAQDDGALVWLPGMVQGLRQNTVLAAGLRREGEWVAGASVQLGGGIGELAGVWTLPAKQGQGLAFELCQHLLRNYFDAGHDLCWLSAAEGARRLYEKLGFRAVGTQLNYGFSQSAPAL